MGIHWIVPKSRSSSCDTGRWKPRRRHHCAQRHRWLNTFLSTSCTLLRHQSLPAAAGVRQGDHHGSSSSLRCRPLRQCRHSTPPAHHHHLAPLPPASVTSSQHAGLLGWLFALGAAPLLVGSAASAVTGGPVTAKTFSPLLWLTGLLDSSNNVVTCKLTVSSGAPMWPEFSATATAAPVVSLMRGGGSQQPQLLWYCSGYIRIQAWCPMHGACHHGFPRDSWIKDWTLRFQSMDLEWIEPTLLEWYGLVWFENVHGLDWFGACRRRSGLGWFGWGNNGLDFNPLAPLCVPTEALKNTYNLPLASTECIWRCLVSGFTKTKTEDSYTDHRKPSI